LLQSAAHIGEICGLRSKGLHAAQQLQQALAAAAAQAAASPAGPAPIIAAVRFFIC
jgi:ABC-type hemin transport system substrate-binding protein